jgi:hypothetical protein
MITAKCGQQIENLKVVIKKDSMLRGEYGVQRSERNKSTKNAQSRNSGYELCRRFCGNSALVTDRLGDGDIIIPVHISILYIT